MLHSCRSRLFGMALMLMLCWTASQAGAADLKYLPEDTEILLHVNFRQIMDSPLVKGQKDAVAKIKSLVENVLGDNEEAQKYLKATGFDLFRDLSSVTVAHPGGHDQKAGLIIIEGDFSPEKFHADAADAVKDHGDVITITQDGKYKIIEVSAPQEHNGVVVMVNKNIVLACSTKDRIKAALVRAEGSEKGKLKKELKSLLDSTSAKQSISVVATGAALAKIVEKAPVPNAQGAVEVLKQIDGLGGAITIAKDVQFQLSVAAKDENTANTLVKQANQLLPIGKFIVMQKAQQDPRLLPVIDVMNTLRATVQGTSFLLRGEITVDNIDKLMKSFPNANQ
jgi:hypothetical protein